MGNQRKKNLGLVAQKIIEINTNKKRRSKFDLLFSVYKKPN